MLQQSKNYTNILIEYPNNITDIIRAISKEEIDAIMVSEQIKNEIKFETPADPEIIFQLIHPFILSLATKDPTRVHFDIVRTVLKNIIDDSLISDLSVDLTARNLVNHCNKLKIEIAEIIPKEIFEQIAAQNNTEDTILDPNSAIQPPYFKIITLNNKNLFETNRMFILDHVLLKVLSNTGKYGKNAAKFYSKKFIERLTLYKSQAKNPISFWFNTKAPSPQEPFHVSPALQLLTRCIYEDIVKKSLNFSNNNPEGLTTNVNTAITSMAMAPFENKMEKNAKSIKLFNNLHLVGSIEIAMVPSTLIECVWNGVSEFNSLTAIRLLRLLIKSTYDEKVRGNSDFRILKFPGAAQEIAAHLNLKSKQEITKIKNLLHAWNHFTFAGPEITSRLLNLGTCKAKSQFSTQEGYEITVLSPLLPYRIFEENGGFIIPLFSEPPLIGKRCYHAKQFIFQWKIAEEFVKHSTQLATNGFVFIAQERWLELARFCNIPEKMVTSIQESWTGPSGFLEQRHSNCYTLKGEDKALKFLTEQGQYRIIQSKRGLKSVALKHQNRRIS